MKAFETKGGFPKTLHVEILSRFLDESEMEELLAGYEKAKLHKYQDWAPTVEETNVVDRLMAGEISVEEAGKAIGYKQVARTMQYLARQLKEKQKGLVQTNVVDEVAKLEGKE